MSDWQEAGRAALDRLLAVADGDSGGETRVRKFLLSWWNTGVFGGFDPTDLWSLDGQNIRDIFCVLVLINNCKAYPDALGYRSRFDWLIVRWHPDMLDPEALQSRRYRDHVARLQGMG